ncbi:MAG TPA: hypothetical protein VM408_03835 [Methylomirabilota bacterium]|nr:hypothetical protein [Methylomirabilota bacterium]
MTTGRSYHDDVVRNPAASGGGPRGAIVVALLIAVAAFGGLGRILPDAGGPTQAAPSRGSAVAAARTPAVAGFVLVSPIAGTVWLRATELDVWGTAPPDVRAIEAVVRLDKKVIGEGEIDVGPAGRFDAAIPIIPPGERAAATLELRELGGSRRTLAEVPFSVDAGALVLIRDPSTLHGQTGRVLVVDILVYGRLREVRGLLTSQGGALIVKTSRRLSDTAPSAAGPPRAVTLELQLPGDAPTGRARLHVIGVDDAGVELEHVDVNVRVSRGG